MNKYINENKNFFNNKTKVALFKLGYLINKLMEKMSINEKSDFSVNVLKNMDHRYATREYIIKKLFPKITIMSEEYNINSNILYDISEVIVDTELNDLNKEDMDHIGYISLGMIQGNKFEEFISLKEACKLYGKTESTLKANIKDGNLKVGTDVRKFGTTWAFNINALERECIK